MLQGFGIVDPRRQFQARGKRLGRLIPGMRIGFGAISLVELAQHPGTETAHNAAARQRAQLRQTAAANGMQAVQVRLRRLEQVDRQGIELRGAAFAVGVDAVTVLGQQPCGSCRRRRRQLRHEAELAHAFAQAVLQGRQPAEQTQTRAHFEQQALILQADVGREMQRPQGRLDHGTRFGAGVALKQHQFGSARARTALLHGKAHAGLLGAGIGPAYAPGLGDRQRHAVLQAFAQRVRPATVSQIQRQARQMKCDPEHGVT